MPSAEKPSIRLSCTRAKSPDELMPKRTLRTRLPRMVTRSESRPIPDEAFIQSASVQADASAAVNTSESCSSTSHDGPETLWSSIDTMSIDVSGGACDGLIDSPRKTQCCAARTSRLRSRGAWPGCAATVMGAAL